MNKLILERKEKEVFMEVRIQSIHFDEKMVPNEAVKDFFKD